MSDKRRCPDDGTCHHWYGEGPCFRVQCCGPLSGVYPDDQWPEDVRANEFYKDPENLRITGPGRKPKR